MYSVLSSLPHQVQSKLLMDVGTIEISKQNSDSQHPPLTSKANQDTKKKRVKFSSPEGFTVKSLQDNHVSMQLEEAYRLGAAFRPLSSASSDGMLGLLAETGLFGGVLVNFWRFCMI